jgi:hypothetical protein
MRRNAGFPRGIRYRRTVGDDGAIPGEFERTRDAGAVLATALSHALAEADAALDGLSTSARRREGVRTARRALKAARAVAPLARTGAARDAIDGVVEFAAKANQLLGPLRDRDALARSIQRLADRFADPGARRVTRTVLLATLVLAEGDRRSDAAYAEASVERARRAIRAARDSFATIAPLARFDTTHAAELLARTFAACRAELDAALASGDLARLHECRKKASFLALSLAPLDPRERAEGDATDAAPSPRLSSNLRRLRARARSLAAALGEDRDLALLDVEMRAARAQLAGSPLVGAIDDALRLARLESNARMEDAARAFLRLPRKRLLREMTERFCE